MLCLLILFAAIGYLLATRFGKRRPPWARSTPETPESAAKRVLAERFAHGDIGVDEFMERASVLNWTPGTEPRDRR